MSIGDIILALIVAAVVFFAVRSVFVKKSVGCGGDCAHCGGSCHHLVAPYGGVCSFTLRGCVV